MAVIMGLSLLTTAGGPDQRVLSEKCRMADSQTAWIGGNPGVEPGDLQIAFFISIRVISNSQWRQHGGPFVQIKAAPSAHQSHFQSP